MLLLMSQEEKPLSELETKIAKAYRINESVENEQREIEVRLNKIEGLKPLLPNRKYGQKWEDLEFGLSAQSLIERQQDIYKLVEERTNKNIYTTYVEAAAILDDEVEDKNRQARETLEQLVKKKLLKTSTVITDKDSRGKRYWTT